MKKAWQLAPILPERGRKVKRASRYRRWEPSIGAPAGLRADGRGCPGRRHPLHGHVAEGLLLGSVNQPSPAVPDAPRLFNRMLAARPYTTSAWTAQAARSHPASMPRIAAAISVGPGSTAASSGGENGTGTPGLPRRRGAVLSAPKARSVTSAMISAWMPHVR